MTPHTPLRRKLEVLHSDLVGREEERKAPIHPLTFLIGVELAILGTILAVLWAVLTN